MIYDPNKIYDAPIVTPLRDYYKINDRWYDSFFDQPVALNVALRLDERYTDRDIKIVTDCTLAPQCLQIRPRIDKDGKVWI